jgi:hypothetical protein
MAAPEFLYLNLTLFHILAIVPLLSLLWFVNFRAKTRKGLMAAF